MQIEERLHIANRVSIKPNYLVVTKILEGFGARRSQLQLKTAENLKDNTHKGKLSEQSQRKIKSAINWLYAASKRKRVYSKRERKSFEFRVNFATLTIPPQKDSQVTSPQLQQLLNALLVYGRKYWFLSNYVWKVELHKDARLHIHLMTDTFIHHRELRRIWNQLLTKKGLLVAHYEKHGNYDPNSTDIHSVWKVRNVAAYVAKYMSKDAATGESFKGRIWGCSYALSQQHKCSCEVEPHYNSSNTSCLTNTEIKWKPIKGKPDMWGICRTIADLFVINTSQWRTHITGKIKDTFAEHIRRIRAGMQQPTIDYLTINSLSPYKQPSEPCETKSVTRKTGPIQSALQF